MIKLTNRYIPLIFLLFSMQILFSQESSLEKHNKKTYTTKHISEAPVLDGVLNDESWKFVEWGTDFLESEPNENTLPSEQTKYKLIYDDKNIYVAIKSYDAAKDSIVRRLSRRDGFVGDRVSVIIDSYHDLRTAFIFTVTAAGVKGDEIATNNGDQIDDSWNPIWYAKTALDEDGWVAEMKIPLSQLRFGKAKEQVWGFNVSRYFYRKSERSVWNRVPVDASGFISESGALLGLKNLIPQKQFEIQPFAVVQHDLYPTETGNPFRDGSDLKLNVGLDAKIGITNDLTLDLTVNPDFGQVEADPAAISLDGFQIFFEEQRPFFVENKNIFNYQFSGNQDNLFYSRRIGRSPHGNPSLQEGEYSKSPQNTTILGAAKFSGKTKKGWSIGVLESVTSKEYAKIEKSGSKREELVEPFTNYFVGRVQKDFNNRNTFFGGMLTTTNRKLEENLNHLRKEALTWGLDFRHQWKNRTYYLEGNLIGSHVSGSKEAIENTQLSITHLFQREGAKNVSVDPTRTSLTGTGGKLGFGKEAGGNFTFHSGIVWKSPELELNDIGFLRQADEIRQYATLNYKTLKPFGKFRQLNLRLRQHTTFDFDGNHNRLEYQINGSASLRNYWGMDFGGAHKPRIYVNTMLRGGPRWKYSEENYGFLFVGSDSRKKLRLVGGIIYSQAKQNNFSLLRLEGGITYQPTNALQVSIHPEYSRNPTKTQYVSTKKYNGSNRYILGSMNNQTFSSAIRLNYTVNPNLSIQYYGQPFISRGRFKNFKYVTNPVADNLYDRFYQYPNNEISENNGDFFVDENIDGVTDYSFGKPDFSIVQFRSNFVLRWEYIAGSEIFFVWSQGVSGLTDPELALFDGLDDQILNKKPENTFLIKATYRFML